MSKETYESVTRDLLKCQKRPPGSSSFSAFALDQVAKVTNKPFPHTHYKPALPALLTAHSHGSEREVTAQRELERQGTEKKDERERERLRD